MAKYSFEATTVGEMLDTPEIMELINKYIPAVLEHPLLEVGRSFIFNDALPYIEDMVTEDDLAAYKEALEAVRKAIELNPAEERLRENEKLMLSDAK